ncbi:MAG: hypothetical protein Barrevirus17_6 [Barrevirus sp.]|uniref:Uncharacterized protein n=1 Tax=Barrevirus sp. TaxID=2487763 RepID=A0A3G4ZQJ9_9VIRU|nr:MAG: hypothetical protein Barrevirus17_6 [Barrevirus sp.]
MSDRVTEKFIFYKTIQHKVVNGVEYKYCGKCDKWLPLDRFYNKTQSSDGKSSTCKKCEQESQKCEFEGCPNGKETGRNGFCKSHGDKIHCIVAGCNRLEVHKKMCEPHYCSGNIKNCAIVIVNSVKASDRTRGRECDITYQDVVDMYNKNNNCHWCSHFVRLEYGGNDSSRLDNISLDRINNDIGHKKNNCVISCLFCNYAKCGGSSEHWKTVVSVLKGTVKTLDFSKYVGSTQVKKGSLLKEFDKKYEKSELISIPWMYSEIKKNGWICAITGLPLYPSTEFYFPWHPSVDRVDNDIGHKMDNCRITCRFINLGKNDIESDKFDEWFAKRFPNCGQVKATYPKTFQATFKKLFDKHERELTLDDEYKRKRSEKSKKEVERRRRKRKEKEEQEAEEEAARKQDEEDEEEEEAARKQDEEDEEEEEAARKQEEEEKEKMMKIKTGKRSNK